MKSTNNLPAAWRSLAFMKHCASLLACCHVLAAPAVPESLVVAAGPEPPVIDEQPIGRTLSEGGHVALSVLAGGAAPLSYQWWKDGQLVTNNLRMAGATNGVLNIDPAQISDSGEYSAVVAASGASVTSAVVSVVVTQLVLQVTPMGGDGALLTIYGAPGNVYRIERSVNFGPWLTNGYVTNITGRAEFFDDETGGFRNYRARFDHMPPILYAGGRDAPGGLRAYGKLNQIWQFEGTADFRQWESLETITNVTGWVKFTDPAEPRPAQRFYRITPP